MWWRRERRGKNSIYFAIDESGFEIYDSKQVVCVSGRFRIGLL